MKPDFHKITSFNAYTLILLLKGSGVLEVDFKNYSLTEGKAIFLAPGQYLRILSGDLQLSRYEFEGDPLVQVENARYLFKHLISLGYVDVSRPKRFHLPALNMLQIAGDDTGMLETAISDWLKLNPFRATREEIDVLFDLKDFIDAHYQESLSLDKVAAGMDRHSGYLKRLTRARLASTVNRLVHHKVLSEAQRQVAFTDRPTKELAYDLGFAYPTYFNRFFKKYTSKTPGEFRDAFGLEIPDTFREEFIQLLDEHFRDERFMGFYADQLFMSPKTLSAKVKSSFGTSFNDLLNQRLINTGRSMLREGENVTETAYALGFKEPNHFTAFFKTHTGLTPSAFLAD